METIGDGFSILDLQGIIVRIGIVKSQQEITGEIVIWLRNSLLTQEFSSGLSDIGQRQRLFSPKRFLDSQVPLVGTRELQVRRESDCILIRRLRSQCRQVRGWIGQRQRNLIQKRGFRVRKCATE